MSADITGFEGRLVRAVKVAVTNAGDGLSDAMEVEPVEIHHGERGYLLLEWECVKVRFDSVYKKIDGELEDTEEVDRIQILRAGTAVLVDEDFAGDVIRAQRERIAAAKAEREGQSSLPFDEDEDEEAPLPGSDDFDPVADIFVAARAARKEAGDVGGVSDEE